MSPHRSQSSSESTLLKERLEEMQSSYHTLAHIAIELVEALESAVSGVSVSFYHNNDYSLLAQPR